MGLFDKPAIAEGTIKQLAAMPYFKLLAIRTRDVKTVYGETEAVDMDVEIDGETKTFSGFSAGIRFQAKQAQDSDFPCLVRIRSVDLGGGKNTTELEPVSGSPGDDDIPF